MAKEVKSMELVDPDTGQKYLIVKPGGTTDNQGKTAGKVLSGKIHYPYSNTAVAVADTLTTIATVDVTNSDTIGLEITETAGVYALDQFVISGRYHASGTYQTLYSVAGDYTSPSGLLVATSGDLTTIAASGTGSFIMDCDGLESVRVQAASSNAAGSTVDVYGGAK